MPRGQALESELVIPTSVSSLIEKGKATVKVLSMPSTWFGAIYPDAKAGVVQAIKGLVEAGEYPENLWG